MKWGGYNRKGEERMKKLFSGKAMYYLLTIATLGSTANIDDRLIEGTQQVEEEA